MRTEPCERAGTVVQQREASARLRGLQHEIHETFQQVQDLRGEWDDLATEHGDLFSCFDWCEIWWKHFGAGRRLEIHTLREDGRLVGVLPLFRETLWATAAGLRVVQLVACDHTLDAAGLAIDPSYGKVFLERVLDGLAQRGEWDLLHMGPLRSYMGIADALADTAASHDQVHTVLVGQQDHWLTMFHLPSSYEAYLEALPNHERRDTLRRQRKLQQQHQVEVRLVDEPDEVAGAMDALVRMHQELWTTRGHRGQFTDWPGYNDFHFEMALRLAGKRQLALLQLEIDGQVRGTIYGYRFGSRVHALISGHHQEPPWHVFGLGRMLHCQLVERAIGWGVRVVDDGRGAFAHKQRLGGRLHGERSLGAVNRRPMSRVRFWMALRIAYLVHVVYGRIWYDHLAPRIAWHRPLRESYIRSRFLAHLYRRTRGRLFGRTPLKAAPSVVPVHLASELNAWLGLAGKATHALVDSSVCG
jgi:CelD/BcsL family acetyltransferase involved in cellulose biosynthesis